ncbi:MAG: N-acetyl-gamma-glutamyl-phosphate reductase [Deltaproteobacteria bacterium]|nr:N-acetyl-gamma-glutamyl-phosphate reductase [Deltaproteobacteria bacterium]
MKKEKKKVTVVGGSGYTGLELLRLLLLHPEVEVIRVTSRQYEGKPVQRVFPSLGKTSLIFTAPNLKEIVKDSDVVFTAVPHQKAMEVIPEIMGRPKCKVIDLSADFRIKAQKNYEAWYQVTHEAPWLLDQAVYGLPEIHGQEIKKARLIGNPGCYPTSIILGLAPLLKEKLVKTEGIIADSKSGVSGAGRTLNLGSLFCETGEGFRAYKVGGGHRHIPEMEQELSLIAGKSIKLTFTPHLVPMSRGILSTMYTRPVKKISAPDLERLYQDFYRAAPFVRLCPEGEWPSTLQVRGSNYCQIGWSLDSRTGQLIILTAIDNLVKGASGQAIQNMNILFGWDQTLGLTQLPLYP